ncbi:MAG: FecR family protein, partial [Thermoguttaceae bacterium]
MIEPRRPHDELNDLLWAIEDGSISAEGVARLDELVCKDPTLLRQYVEYARLLADLRFGLPARSARDALHQVFRGLGTSVPSETSEAADEFGASVPTPEPSVPTLLADSADPFATPHSSLRGWLLSYVAATVVVGAAIVAAWFYRMSPSPKADFNQPQIVHRDAPKPAKVGRISDMANCRLGRSANAAHDRNGPVARGQTFALDSGFLEIAYDSGATVLLQGPCAYEVDSDRGGFLSRGKLVARVAKSEVRRPQSPIPSPLFTIRTPTATVTDLGTEFGVEVDAAGATRSSVFEGRVDVAPHESNAQKATAKRPIRLVAGQSVRVARDAEGHGLRATRGQADAASFPVRPGHLAEFAEQERLKPFRRWLAYSQRLRKDP